MTCSLLTTFPTAKKVSIDEHICKEFQKPLSNGIIPFCSAPNWIRRNKMILIVNSLISLEDRLVSLHIAFTQICQLGYKRSQLGLICTIINIPYDVALIMIYQEIAIFHDNCCAPKIKLEYKSTTLSRNGRPTVMMHALYKLCRTTLYKENKLSFINKEKHFSIRILHVKLLLQLNQISYTFP